MASLVSAQIAIGPVFMQATQIYRRHSVMRQDDTVTNQQDDRPSGQDNMTNRQVNRTSRQDDRTNRQDDRPSGQDHIITNRQDNRTSRQGSIENRHRVIFDLIPLHRHHLFMLMTQDHPPNIIFASKNLILKN